MAVRSFFYVRIMGVWVWRGLAVGGCFVLWLRIWFCPFCARRFVGRAFW